MKRFFRENGLSITLLSAFLVCWVAQAITGNLEYNEQQREHGEEPVALGEYLGSGHFLEATAENWESEFLQMGFYVLLTIFLRQKGSSESKKLDELEEVDEDPRRHRNDPQAPAPVRRGGWVLRVYENSLSLAFVVLFAVSFVLHAVGGMEEYNQEQQAHGAPTVGLGGYMATSRFWFESFQNWQSEFLAVAAIVLLSIVLRQRGSPESKPVAASYAHTGSS